MSVCPWAYLKTSRLNFTSFFYFLPKFLVAVARSSSGSVVSCNVLPVLLTMPCVHLMATWKWHMFKVTCQDAVAGVIYDVCDCVGLCWKRRLILANEPSGPMYCGGLSGCLIVCNWFKLLCMVERARWRREEEERLEEERKRLEFLALSDREKVPADCQCMNEWMNIFNGKSTGQEGP